MEPARGGSNYRELRVWNAAMITKLKRAL